MVDDVPRAGGPTTSSASRYLQCPSCRTQVSAAAQCVGFSSRRSRCCRNRSEASRAFLPRWLPTRHLCPLPTPCPPPPPPPPPLFGIHFLLHLHRPHSAVRSHPLTFASCPIDGCRGLTHPTEPVPPPLVAETASAAASAVFYHSTRRATPSVSRCAASPGCCVLAACPCLGVSNEL